MRRKFEITVGIFGIISAIVTIWSLVSDKKEESPNIVINNNNKIHQFNRNTSDITPLLNKNSTKDKRQKIKEICPPYIIREGNNDICRTIRIGKSYLFSDKFSIKNKEIKFKHYDVKFKPDSIYNKGKIPSFFPTKWIKSQKYILKTNTTTKDIIKADDFYKIKTRPFNNKRSYNNIRIYYKLQYINYEDGKENGKIKTNLDVIHYAISWCGDGIVDTQYGEECEPAKNGYACSEACKLLKNHKI